MYFQILGPLRVRVPDAHGDVVSLGGIRQRAVLLGLLLRANRPVGVPTLCDAVWDVPPAAPESNLRTYIAGLRKRFAEVGCGDRLSTEDGCYLLRVHPGELDLEIFDARAGEGDRAAGSGDSRLAADRYGRALALYHGAPLPEDRLGHALRAEHALLYERYQAIFQRYAGLRIALGECADVIGDLRRQVETHPLREELAGMLMTALHATGRTAEALRVYETVRRLLDDELGCEPGERLRRTHLRVLGAADDAHRWVRAGG